MDEKDNQVHQIEFGRVVNPTRMEEFWRANISPLLKIIQKPAAKTAAKPPG